MELVIFALYFAGKWMLQAIIIAAMAIPVGFGLSIGYMLGKSMYGALSARRRIRKLAAAETKAKAAEAAALTAQEIANANIGKDPLPEGAPA